MTTVAGAPRSPWQPRSTRADEAIIEAVLDLLGEGTPIELVSIEAVATRAGVGKATIYRRWPNKDALLLDAVRALKGPVPEPAGLSVRDDLVMLARAMGRNRDPRVARIMPCLIPEMHRNPEQYRLYQEFVEQRRAVTRRVLERGVQTGELRADLDIELAMTLLAGPILIQRLMRWHPDLDDETLPERVVDAVLAGIAN